MNRRTLGSEKLLSSSPSRKSALMMLCVGQPTASLEVVEVEYPQMWVWPQVALGGPPPPPPCAPGSPAPHQPGPPPPGALQKEPSGWGEEGRRGRGGKGFGLREGSSNDNGGLGGGNLQTSVGARPTSGGFVVEGFLST